MMRALIPLFGLSFLILAACSVRPAPGPGASGEPIRPYAGNPRFWEYRGEPVLLIGGSREDNLFQIPDIEAHLDLLASVGGNYIRNTMSSRDSGNVWPFFRRPDGKYDLEQLNDEYFERFEDLLRLAVERDIFVQIELWDRFDFAREPWLENPYRPANNVNYTSEESGLEDEYPRHPGQNDNPFFRSIPAHDANAYLLKYQNAQVDRLLEIALEYPNVLYTMDNETNATPDWGAYWSDYIERAAAARGVEVYTTEMWDAHDLKHEEHRHTLDHPETYAFVDISQNNHNTDQRHWDNLQWARAYVASQPRPLNHVKIYGADTGRYGTSRDGVERFWRNLVGGAASIRFHRPPTGLGLSEVVQASLRSARMLLETFDPFRATPDAESRLLGERDPDEAYLTYVTGEQYIVYFPDGGAVTLDLSGEEGAWSLRWLDVAASQWGEPSPITAGESVLLETPGDGHRIAVLNRRGDAGS